MPTRTYNIFYPGIKQDDKIGSPGFIEGNNLNGLTTGEGVTLGPKSNKLFTSNAPIRGLFVDKRTTTDNDRNFAFGDNGEIYNFNSSDLTPLYTVSGNRAVRGFTIISGRFYFLYESIIGSTGLNLGQSTDLGFTSVDENYGTGFIIHDEVVPIIDYGDLKVFGGTTAITTLPSGLDPIVGKQTYSLFSGTCKGIANYGNQLYLYNDKGRVDIWDGSSNALSGSNNIDFPPRKIHQTASATYVASMDGGLYVGNGWQFGTGPIKKYIKSNRLDNNSIYQDKFNFSGGSEVKGKYIESAGNRIYVGCNDSTPGIYIFDNIVAGTQKGLHKAITTIHDGTAIDEIYAIEYDHTQDRVFYSYKAGTTYGVDYISTVDRNSASIGTGVTEVFTGGTSFKKKINTIRMSAENIDANKIAKLYYRVNNGDWILLRNVNSGTDDIYYRENIYKDSNGGDLLEFIDIQFKIELNSSNNDENPPILNELILDYNIIQA